MKNYVFAITAIFMASVVEAEDTYTRTQVWNEGYYVRSGCGYVYYPGRYTYSYTPYKAPASPVVDLSYKDGWEVEHAKVLRDTIKYGTYMKSLNIVAPLAAAQGNYQASSGSYGAYAAQQNSQLFGTFGINTSTAWGYNPGLAASIPRFDPNQAFLTVAQLQDAYDQAGSKGRSELNTIVGNAANNTEVQKLESVLKAIREAYATPKNTSTTASFGPAFAVDTLQSRFNAAAQGCVQCHSGEKKEGGWIVSDLSNQNIMDRILRPVSDPKHMPKGGQMLPVEHIVTWMQATQSSPKMEKVK